VLAKQCQYACFLCFERCEAHTFLESYSPRAWILFESSSTTMRCQCVSASSKTRPPTIKHTWVIANQLAGRIKTAHSRMKSEWRHKCMLIGITIVVAKRISYSQLCYYILKQDHPLAKASNSGHYNSDCSPFSRHNESWGSPYLSSHQSHGCC
jgi:hypothetical protein